MGATTAAILSAAPAWCAEEKASDPTDTELLSSARDRIERHRQGEGVIRVVDAAGRTVPQARVAVEQSEHEFLFGCNLFSFGRCADHDQEQQYRQRFATLFNYCTLGFYWAGYEPERGQPNYQYTDRVLEWTHSQGIVCKGHPLVWDHPAASPSWLPDDPRQIARLVVGRVGDTVSHFRGQIAVWDVVNEPTHLPNGVNRTKMAAWGADVGPVAYCSEPLRAARSANPHATLLVNDYRTDSPYYQVLTQLRERGKWLPDAVGIQSHMHQGLWSLSKVQSVCARYAQLGLPLHFTETTILSGGWDGARAAWGPTEADGESRQAAAAAQFYTMLFAQPAVQALTWWDFSDYQAWQNAPAGLLRADMSPKPAYERLAELIKREWWTKTSNTTDQQGRMAWRGFYGRYHLTAQTPANQHVVSQVALRPAGLNQFEIKLPS